MLHDWRSDNHKTVICITGWRLRPLDLRKSRPLKGRILQKIYAQVRIVSVIQEIYAQVRIVSVVQKYMRKSGLCQSYSGFADPRSMKL
jgi:hypothetical protein